jgi:hypothetical protein
MKRRQRFLDIAIICLLKNPVSRTIRLDDPVVIAFWGKRTEAPFALNCSENTTVRRVQRRFGG